MPLFENELSSNLLSERQREMIRKFGCGSIDINIDSIDDLGGLVVDDINCNETIESKHYLEPSEILGIFESILADA